MVIILQDRTDANKADTRHQVLHDTNQDVVLLGAHQREADENVCA